MARTPDHPNKTAGVRLKIARQALGFTIKTLIEEDPDAPDYRRNVQKKWVKVFGSQFSEKTLRTWEKNGVPESKIVDVAGCFDSDYKHFTDKSISIEDFKKSILGDLYEKKEEIPDSFLKRYENKIEEVGLSKHTFKKILKIFGGKNIYGDDIELLIEEVIQKCKEIKEQLSLLQDDDPVIAGLQSSASNAYYEGDFNEAQSLLDEAKRREIEITNTLESRLIKRYISTAKTIGLHGKIEDFKFNFDKAISHYKRAIHLIKRAVYLSAESPELEKTYAMYLQKLGIAYCEDGKNQKAEKILKESLSIYERYLDESSLNVAENLTNLAWVYNFQEYFKDAINYCKKALDIYKSSNNENSLKIADTLSKLGEIYKKKGDFEKAISLYNQVLDIRAKKHGMDSIKVTSILDKLGDFHRINRNDDESKKYYERSLKIKKDALPSEHPNIAYTLFNMGLLFHAQGKFDEAKDYYDKSKKIREKRYDEKHPIIAYCLNMIGKLYCDQGEYDEAESYVKKALDIRIKILGTNVTTTAISYEHLGIIYHGQKKYDDAKIQLHAALSIVENSVNKDHLCRAYILVSLGDLYGSLDDHLKSLEYYEEALEIRKKRLRPKHPDILHCRRKIKELRKK